MSHHQTLTDFFDHEISEIQRNINHLKHGLDDKDPHDKRLLGQQAMLEQQQEHLRFVKELKANANTYEDAIAICREYIIASEKAHAAIASREDGTMIMHSNDWWNTLHHAQFAGNVLHRLRSWHQEQT